MARLAKKQKTMMTMDTIKNELVEIVPTIKSKNIYRVNMMMASTPKCARHDWPKIRQAAFEFSLVYGG